MVPLFHTHILRSNTVMRGAPRSAETWVTRGCAIVSGTCECRNESTILLLARTCGIKHQGLTRGTNNRSCSHRRNYRHKHTDTTKASQHALRHPRRSVMVRSSAYVGQSASCARMRHQGNARAWNVETRHPQHGIAQTSIISRGTTFSFMLDHAQE